MSQNILMFTEYSHMDAEKGKLHPYFVVDGPQRGFWFMADFNYKLTFAEICSLCNIPEHEQLILRLKYG
jgi:hypothetical protein